MSNNNAVRLKIFKAKEEIRDISDLLKKVVRGRPYETKNVNKEIILYYKQSLQNIPKWYSTFLNLEDDIGLFSSYVSAFFFKEVKIDDKNIIFAFTFGGGESGLNLENFDESFGLRIALNLAESFVNIRKDNISTTQSKIREQAIKGQTVNSFGIDFEKDMLYGVTVIPVQNSISESNISGSISLSVAKTINLNELDDFLIECYTISENKQYEERYPFINRIKEVKNNSTLIEKINSAIVSNFNNRDRGRVWFSSPDFIDWEEIVHYELIYKGISKTISEICVEAIDEIIKEKKHSIDEIKDFRNIKIQPVLASKSSDEEWSALDCLYAQVVVDGKTYVFNNKRYYEIDDDYEQSINEKFNQLTIEDSLDEFTKTEREEDYIKGICKKNDSLVLMDQKTITINTPIEICDIFNISNKTFIHIKKYASSAVLSHLFSQAYVSADIFTSQEGKNKFLEKLKSQNDKVEDDYNITHYGVNLAIITKEKLNGTHVNLPFFSKINIISTVEKIQNMGFGKVAVMYIHSSVPLYKKHIPKENINAKTE